MATGISFFDLPSLVQAKVIREHVSAVQKARTLSDMPEFRDMLESRHCWSNPSPEFFDFYGVLRSLRPGLYFSNTGFGFRVSVNEDVVSFEFCAIAKFHLLTLALYYSKKNLKFKGSFSETSEFLKTFLNKYTFLDKDTIDIYKFGHGHFLVNRSNKTVRWFDSTYDLNEKNECVISDLFGSDHVRLVVRDKVVFLTCLATVRCEEYYCPCRKTNERIESAKLESFYKSYRSTFKLHFRVEGNDDYVSINAQRVNLDGICKFSDTELYRKFQEFKPRIY